jgi:hypothetical protein
MYRLKTITRWTSPERAAKMLKKHRKVITAANFNQEIRDRELPLWLGHIGLTGATEPSCGCPACTSARFNMKV